MAQICMETSCEGLTIVRMIYYFLWIFPDWFDNPTSSAVKSPISNGNWLDLWYLESIGRRARWFRDWVKCSSLSLSSACFNGMAVIFISWLERWLRTDVLCPCWFVRSVMECWTSPVSEKSRVLQVWNAGLRLFSHQHSLPWTRFLESHDKISCVQGVENSFILELEFRNNKLIVLHKQKSKAFSNYKSYEINLQKNHKPTFFDILAYIIKVFSVFK